MARSLRCQVVYKHRQKRWSLQSNLNLKGSWWAATLPEQEPWLLVQSPPVSREICCGPNCTPINAVMISSREWIQIKPRRLGKDQCVPTAYAAIPSPACFWSGSAHRVTTASACAASWKGVAAAWFCCSFLWADRSCTTICFSCSVLQALFFYNLLWSWIDGKGDNERKHFHQNNVSFQGLVTTWSTIKIDWMPTVGT